MKLRKFLDFIIIAFFASILLYAFMYGFMYAWDNDPNFQLSQTYEQYHGK